jgi:hypothetical protein
MAKVFIKLTGLIENSIILDSVQLTAADKIILRPSGQKDPPNLPIGNLFLI